MILEAIKLSSIFREFHDVKILFIVTRFLLSMKYESFDLCKDIADLNIFLNLIDVR